MTHVRSRKFLRWSPAILALVLAGCIVFQRVEVQEVDPTPSPGRSIATPVRAHLLDGSTVTYPNGVLFRNGELRAEGEHYSLTLDRIDRGVIAVPIDSVAALETYRTRINYFTSGLATTLATTAVTGATVVGGTALAAAIFGSCPTVYSESDSGLVLEAESFSNSIAPLLELRDVDRLHATADASGRIQLEIRNEALETHYINHLELVEVAHEKGAYAVPGNLGSALVLRDVQAPPRIVDRAGNDVTSVLKAVDSLVYRTDERVLEAVRSTDPMDHIDLVLPTPETDTVAVVLRLKNSLLNTVFFYDFMLASQGIHALDWLGKELETVSMAIEMSDFYARRMGLRVSVWEDGAYRQIDRVNEVGPIAWSDVAVPIPVPAGDSLRVRLSFIADAWRIDRAAIASHVRTESAHTIPVHRVLDAQKNAHSDALDRVLQPDEDYLVTSPGTRFWVEFEAGPAAAGTERTFFLAAQGYYIEWIRGDWVRDIVEPKSFEVSDDVLVAVIEKWKEVKPDFEERFEKTKIPVQ